VLLLSVFIGLITGVVSVLMKNVTHYIQEMVQTGYFTAYFNPYYFAFPVIGIVITVLIKKFFLKDRVAEPIPSTLFAISRKNGFIKARQMFSYFITSIFTVGFGGSVGLEGPAVGTGSAIGANLGRLFKLNYKTRLLMISCACAGAIASIFNAPIAAIIFTIEVFSIDLTFSSLIPLLLASASGAITSIFIQGKSTMLQFKVSEAFNVSDLPFYLLLGVLCALVSVYFTTTSFRMERLFNRVKHYQYRVLIGSLLLGGVIFLVPPLYGEGYTTINHLLNGNIDAVMSESILSKYLVNSWVVLLLIGGLVFLKSFAASFTIGAGGVGGIFAPSLFTGASLGYVFSELINKFKFFDIPVSNFVLVGMAGLMAGALHAPLTAVFMIAEITGGYELFLPLMMVSAISFLVSRGIRPHSIYTDQLAKRGDLLTHNKDQVILTLLSIDQVIEDNFNTVNPEMNMRDLVKVVSQSRRNIFPVVDDEHKLVGVLTLDDFRHLMFDESIYDTTYVNQLMSPPPATIERNEKMDTVMKKFQQTDAWNLPVVEGEVYKGFISKSKLFSVYRSMLIEFSD
jgi:CIC family chloride channel protein